MSSTRPDSDLDAVLHAIPDILPRFDRSQLELFLADVVGFNPQLGLVSKQDTPAVLAKLLRQSVQLWDFVCSGTQDRLPAAPRVVDIGPGGGFPGVVWKMLAADIDLVLVERKSRRAHYLERIAAKLGLKGVQALEKDARELAEDASMLASFDVAVAMAVARPSEVGPWVEPLLGRPGYFCTLRSPGEGDPPERVGEALVRVCSVEYSDSVLVLYEKK